MKCLIPGCNNPKVRARGLCAGCYEAALRKIREGKATWVDLEDAGMALPKPPKTPTGAFALLFEEKFGKDS